MLLQVKILLIQQWQHCHSRWTCFLIWILSPGSFSRSAVNYNAGAQTVVSNIVMASAVLVTLLFLMPLFYYTPNVILGAIIITAVIGLIDYHAAYRLWKVDKLDFLACVCSFFGVLFISVPLGLALAVSSLLLTSPYWLCITRNENMLMKNKNHCVTGWSFSFQNPPACHKTKHSDFGEHSRHSNISQYMPVQRSIKDPILPHTRYWVSYLLCQFHLPARKVSQQAVPFFPFSGIYYD